MKKYFLILVILVLSLLSIIAQEPDFEFEWRQETNFSLPCTLNGFPCSSSAFCNATIKYPNKTSYLILNENMTREDGGDFSINLTFNNLGTHDYKVACQEGGENDTAVGRILVTPTGRTFDTSQGIVAIAILFAALVLAVIFLMIGFKLEQNPATLPIGFLFVIFALFLGVYSLHLSYVYSNDILQYETLIPVTSVIYVTVLWVLAGIAVLSSALMLISFIVQLSRVLKTKKFGEGFNPITNTYDM